MERIRILVVDDSAVVRKIVCDLLAIDDLFKVVGTAADGRQALSQVEALQPDVVTLDIEMPELDGVEAARQMHQRWPELPIIMCSTVSRRGATATLEALGAGAVDYVTKPAGSASPRDSMAALRADLFEKLKEHGGRAVARRLAAAAIAPRVPSCAPTTNDNVERRARPRAPDAPLWKASQRELYRRKVGSVAPQEPVAGPSIVAIGVSTGGPSALNTLLPALPASFPLPIVIVQHMPPLFTRLLAEQLDAKCQLEVHEAQAGMVLEPGHVYLAPGDHHMVVERVGAQCRVALHQEAPENSCRPAVDPLFRSVASCYGNRALAVVLTGMGSDGLKGAEAIHQAGGAVLAQDEKSSVVWGMPGLVAKRGIAAAVLPLDEIAAELLCRVPASGRAGGKVPVRS